MVCWKNKGNTNPSNENIRIISWTFIFQPYSYNFSYGGVETLCPPNEASDRSCSTPICCNILYNRKCLQHLLLFFRISSVDMNKTRPSVSPCLLFDLLLSRGALLAHASLKTMIQELQIQSWHSSISRDDTYPRLKSRGRNTWANNLAHVPWKNAPDFRKTHKERHSFKNCWWRVQGIFQGALGEILEWGWDWNPTHPIITKDIINLQPSQCAPIICKILAKDECIANIPGKMYVNV